MFPEGKGKFIGKAAECPRPTACSDGLFVPSLTPSDGRQTWFHLIS